AHGTARRGGRPRAVSVLGRGRVRDRAGLSHRRGSVSDMKLIRFGEPGGERPGGLLEDGTRVDVSGVGSDYDKAFFGATGIRDLQAWVARNPQAPRADREARLGPPLRRPSKIICIGLNFKDHAAETGAELPKEPVVFFKSTTALVGPNDPLVMPRGATK